MSFEFEVRRPKPEDERMRKWEDEKMRKWEDVIIRSETNDLRPANFQEIRNRKL